MRDWAVVSVVLAVGALVAGLVFMGYCANRGNMHKEQNEQRICVQYGNQWVSGNCIYKGSLTTR